MAGGLLELARERTVIFDGAMGTMLMASGLGPGEVPEQWNLEKPDLVQTIHRRYFDAGSDVVHTNTFGANQIKLGRGVNEIMRLNEAGARIAKEACPPGRFVAGDIGPTGKMAAPLGDVTLEEMEEAFRIQAEALLRGGADLISIETMFSLDEALAALRGARRAGAELVIAATTYQVTKRGFFTMMGEDPRQCARAFEEAGAEVIASNCTLGSRDMIGLAGELRAATEKPVLIQPNAGSPATRDGKTVYEQDPADFARDCLEIRNLGVEMIGGCCGTDQRFIQELARALTD